MATDTWRWAIFGAAIALIGWGLFRLISSKSELKSEVSELSAKSASLTGENRELNDQIDYFGNPANLLNEAKKQTNYRLPGEKLIIIVPGTASTSSTSTAASAK